MQRLVLWLQPPVFSDRDKTRVASHVQVLILTIIPASLLIGLIDYLNGIATTLSFAVVGSLALLLALVLNRRGFTTLAGYILVVVVLSVLTMTLAVGHGIHDIAIMLYPLVIFIASFILRRTGVYITILLVVSSVLLIVLGEVYNLFPAIQQNTGVLTTRLTDALVVGLILLIGSVTTYMLTGTLERALGQARQNELSLAESNRLLSRQTELLRSSETRWRSLVETAPNTILSIVRDGTITFHNKSQYADRVVGKKVFEFLPPDQEPVVRQLIEELFVTGRMAFYEGEIIFDGSRWFSISIGPVTSPDGAVTSLTVVATDIDDYRRMMNELNTNRDQLKQGADRLAALNRIGRTVSTLSDLNSTLQTILEQVKVVLPLDAFYVGLYYPENNQISFPLMYDSGRLWDEPRAEIIPGSQVEKVIQSHLPLLVNRTFEDMKASPHSALIGDRGKVSASILLSPMLVGDTLLGIVSAQSYTRNAYSEDHLALLTGAAQQTAIAIENARLYEALQIELQERRRAEDEVRQLNAELEGRVSARTAELEATNKELESFTYSISHDLRAPLRAINGYSRLLLEDFGPQLSSDSRRFLDRIVESVHRMSQLIDDLLLFSRTTRQTMNVQEISSQELEALVRGVVAQVHASMTARLVDFRVQQLPGCRADPGLLRQVFMNLIGNAFKYSRSRTPPQVEVGAQQEDGCVIYYVRDNGVGFDMKYASKLFGVFQRLHLSEEFEGTGVGLAIVHRIIQRHGGKVWAQAEPDKGATFYFTLNET